MQSFCTNVPDVCFYNIAMSHDLKLLKSKVKGGQVLLK